MSDTNSAVPPIPERTVTAIKNTCDQLHLLFEAMAFQCGTQGVATSLRSMQTLPQDVYDARAAEVASMLGARSFHALTSSSPGEARQQLLMLIITALTGMQTLGLTAEFPDAITDLSDLAASTILYLQAPEGSPLEEQAEGLMHAAEEDFDARFLTNIGQEKAEAFSEGMFAEAGVTMFYTVAAQHTHDDSEEDADEETEGDEELEDEEEDEAALAAIREDANRVLKPRSGA